MSQNLDSEARLTLVRSAFAGLDKAGIVALLRDTEHSWLVMRPLLGNYRKKLEQYCFQMGFSEPRYAVKTDPESKDARYNKFAEVSITTPDGEKVVRGRGRSSTWAWAMETAAETMLREYVPYRGRGRKARQA